MTVLRNDTKMASMYNQFSFSMQSWSSKSSRDPNKQKKHHSLITKGSNSNGSQTKILSQDHDTSFLCGNSPKAEDVLSFNKQTRQIIPREKQLYDPHLLGMLVGNGLEYRQTFVIRSHEVGADKTMTPENMLYLLQETTLNHIWLAGLMREFGTTHGMIKNNLIWVLSRIRLQVDHYPIWNEVIEIDAWICLSGNNGIRRDWLIRSPATGIVLARATSTWALMNKHTRRLSKMPDEVRAELSPWFIEKQTIEESCKEIEKVDGNACYVNSDLKAKRSDLDMNQHVNYVTYVKWMLETIPEEFFESRMLSEITLMYRRECGRSDILQSLCRPQQQHETITHKNVHIGLNGNSSSPLEKPIQGNQGDQFSYTHLLHLKGNLEKGEIVRGRTTWKNKPT